MKIPVISIGNSKGIRLSKSILEMYQIKDAVELFLEKGQIVIKSTSNPRVGWEDAFKSMHDCKDDQPLMEDFFEDESFEEWK